MANENSTSVITKHAITEHLKKTIENHSHLETFYGYLNFWSMTDEEPVYENEFVEELYDMLLAYFLTFQEDTYVKYFKSLLVVLGNNLLDLEHIAVALFMMIIEKLFQNIKVMKFQK